MCLVLLPGEPAEFKTAVPDRKDFMRQEDYALISVVPGLHGKSEIIAFDGASSCGLWAAVEFMTEPRYARELIEQPAHLHFMEKWLFR